LSSSSSLLEEELQGPDKAAAFLEAAALASWAVRREEERDSTLRRLRRARESAKKAVDCSSLRPACSRCSISMSFRMESSSS